MVKKCRAVSEISLMELDLRTTRSPHPASSPTKRKLLSPPAGAQFHLSTFLNFRNRRTRRRVLLPDISDDDDDDDAPALICCSSASNACSEDEQSNRSNDELGENRSRERRETTPSRKFRSPDMESPTTGKSEAGTSGDRSSSVKIMPTDSDLEEFFISAEKNIQKCFAEKYNYDIAEDGPLEGRYEWIRLKP